MIILSWNIRGLGSSSKRREIGNIVRRYKCDVLILCETKLDSLSQPLLRNISRGRPNKWEFLPFQGTSGGILIGWDARLFTYLDIFVGNFSLSLKFRNHIDDCE